MPKVLYSRIKSADAEIKNTKTVKTNTTGK